jgi:hypothetical protein
MKYRDKMKLKNCVHCVKPLKQGEWRLHNVCILPRLLHVQSVKPNVERKKNNSCAMLVASGTLSM